MALLELADAFHSAAASRAKAAREAIEAEVLRDIEERARTKELRQRIEAERVSWDLPGIGVAGWRDAFRARLAALPEKYGAYVRWVEQLDAERRRVILRSGVTVTLAPTRAWTEKSAGHDAMAIMIAHARERGWTRVTITGAPQWRQDLARAVIRARLEVADPDLVEIAEAEKAQMAREAMVETWWRDRGAYLAAPAHDRRALRQALLESLRRLAADPGLSEIPIDQQRREVLVADLRAYERLRGPAAADRGNSSSPGSAR